MYDPTVGRFLEEDPIGFTAGDPNLNRYVANRVTMATDPTGLWNEDVHRNLTELLAVYAGFYGEGNQIGRWCNQPDIDTREANSAYRSGDQERLRRAAGWHYPLTTDADGVRRVHANSAEARRRMEEGLSSGDLKAFSEGLHPLQDSWSHQGRPTLGLVGHSRGGRWVWPAGVTDPAAEWMRTRTRFVYVPGPGGFYNIPVADIPALGSAQAPGYFVPYSGLVAALDPNASADDPRLWPEDVRAAAMETYHSLLTFRGCWPTPMRTRYPAASDDVVMTYLLVRFPGWNADGYPRPNGT